MIQDAGLCAGVHGLTHAPKVFSDPIQHGRRLRQNQSVRCARQGWSGIKRIIAKPRESKLRFQFAKGRASLAVSRLAAGTCLGRLQPAQGEFYAGIGRESLRHQVGEQQGNPRQFFDDLCLANHHHFLDRVPGGYVLTRNLSRTAR